MELLTPEGWSPATSINALVMSVRGMLLMEGHETRLKTRDRKEGAREHDYSSAAAKRDFAHIVSVHRQSGCAARPLTAPVAPPLARPCPSEFSVF